mgnify:FL=1|jgi:hypothetical protein
MCRPTGWKEASTNTNINTDTRMQNTGTWNSDEAILYLFLLILPIAAFFFVGIFTSIIAAFAPILAAILSAERDKPMDSQQDFSGFDFSLQIANQKTAAEKSKSVKKPKKQVVLQAKEVKEADTTETSIINEAVIGLVGLGYKKAEARRIASRAAVSKVYKNSEVLLTEIISSM